MLLVDADPQASALDWVAVRGEDAPFAAVGMPQADPAPGAAQDGQGLRRRGHRRPAAQSTRWPRSAVMASDAVLIPVLPSQFDVWAAEETVKLLEECAALQGAASRPPSSSTARSPTPPSAATWPRRLKQYPQPVLNTAVCQRVAFAESARGRTVLELDPDSAASKEIQSLTKEVLKLAS